MTLSQRDFENRILGFEEGLLEGLIEAYIMQNMSDEEIIERLQQKPRFEMEQIEKYLKLKRSNLGRAAGIINVCTDFGLSDPDIIDQLQARLGITKDQAKTHLDQYKTIV